MVCQVKIFEFSGRADFDRFVVDLVEATLDSNYIC